LKELQTILHILDSTTAPAVLATLVQVEGSSYRRVGARMLWSESGIRVGSISGGCLEEDLIEHARAVLKSGLSKTVVYDTTEENDLVWGVGLGCHGIVHVVLERVEGLPRWMQALSQAWSERRPAVLATLYGSSRRTGTVLAVADAEGTGVGATAIERAANTALLAQRSEYLPNFEGEKGATLFCEFLPPPLLLTLYGAGDDALPLSRLARELGWQVSVFDPRPAMATKARFPGALRVESYSAESPPPPPPDQWAAGVVMTHHYRFDLPLLRTLLPHRWQYLGLLGPKKRADRLLSELQAEGLEITPEMRARLHAPVGLDLGSGTPEAVALCILAEIQAVTTGRNGRPLRERTQPIHG
jgi:xanthine dehydrogenase accessory factor